ncbi:MAG TPA: holo-ACP synthase [Bacillota bacterium]|nr:holo-ACP synthase [Bacillota bacterium]
MIIGTGIDIVDKTRIQMMIEKHGERFVRRILTESEITLVPLGGRKSEFIAGRFAAKEAFAKATGFGFGERLSFQDIELTRDSYGKPYLKIREDWTQVHYPDQEIHFHVSISHEKKYAIAQVIIEG